MKTRLGTYSRQMLVLCTLCLVAASASAELVVIVSSRNPNPVLNAEIGRAHV